MRSGYLAKRECELMNKFKEAIVRHEIAKQKVDAMTSAIGTAIRSCPIAIKSEDFNTPNSERGDLWDEATSKTKTHLWHAFKHREPSSCGYGDVGLDEDGVMDSLSEGSEFECEHCLNAYQLIVQRKEARQELGYARLSIRALGKVAIKEGA